MRFVLGSFFCLSALTANSFGATTSGPARILETAPIRFEPNSGLHPASVQWIARGRGYSFAFTDRATVLRVADRSVRLTFPGANRMGPKRQTQFQGESQQRASTNYFLGEKRLSVPAFSRLREIGVYRGIDVVYYGNGSQIEYDFEIAPGADPSRIRMRFDGADAVRLNDRGEVVLTLGSGEIIQRAPVVYQKRATGKIVTVEAAYRLAKDGSVRLALGGYDPKEQLTVDPVVSYTAVLHGSNADSGLVVTHDSKGVIYMAGNTESTDFPGTNDAAQPLNAGNQDIWVMKLDPTQGSSAIVYCSYIGGPADDTLKAMTIDQNGVFYITGATVSGSYPVTASAIASSSSGNTHAFVSMIDPSQGANGLVYSTYLSGSQNDEGDGIAVANGKIYVTGTTDSDNFPIAGTALQATRSGSFDTFVVEIDPTQSGAASEVFGTFLGGSGPDAGRTIAVDAAGLVYVAGTTYSFDFPLTSNAFQSGNFGGGDGFLSVLNPSTGALTYSTYLGGSSTDEIKKIVIDPAGRVAMAGYTLSFDFPVSKNAYQPIFGGVANAFLAILDLKASLTGVGLTYSTFYGGTGGEVAYDLKLDSAGQYYLCGYTLSQDLPVTANALSPVSGQAGIDGFVAVINPSAATSGNRLVYGSYVTSDGFQQVNSVDVDAAGNIYIIGTTTSDVFPPGSFPNTVPGKPSVFLMVFSLQQNGHLQQSHTFHTIGPQRDTRDRH